MILHADDHAKLLAVRRALAQAIGHPGLDRREARSEFGESLTPERADQETLGTRGIVRASQPETVGDYSILATLPEGREETLVTVEGNHQRLNRLRVDPVTARALRVVVTRTNGLPEARIFELRCYSPSA